ncbi:hypothetical protein COW36_07515 [bacterium (Candidatus Blackallbacteria) CG17_big_fil_post_rev_8_21_14_2_50_48_46]|uniref:Glycosyltransferase RgtA/B/C/D-like domain-containing protein n=1 Tax=bacterium (Candidatus Blackallbacteria) CG17_big_fil_post_rev_8_21_14_2_50_48_46 TaxID=2014261 RepID=A0A2M7G6V3_9BACT|nr:MAG: hypothetical protein COW64_16615 [bacterium (Candidatus Blackallbacteria) CG18_big_fil_WC_8_21_14_2_50_49_26]PIW17784.1 MAG: hypothetical protein COW36_07515 [bacterium (Candidatus Blackallbacteria) CG17_big_fil_post_rev_8_21_14_2_50_48_46]PIW47343.1 MAG: hypothetical protein COW20_13040 [bacterium (Candidatus Blackallbacteria) CG13_big_fil_rev_8_21_14_2_50_49_14]
MNSFSNLVQRYNLTRVHLLLLGSAAVLSSLLLYLPFLLGDATVLTRFWDGPNYMYVAKTLYQIPVDHPFVPYKTTPAYFACHLPFYPLAIRAFSFMGYPVAMLFTTVLFSVLATLTFYQLVKESGAVASPFWSALISLFLPARWLIYHSVGATEAPFLFLICLSLLLYLRKHYTWAFVVAGLAGITRITGILLGLVYLILLVRERNWLRIPLLALIALPLLATFSFYHFQYGDFLAYFHWNNKLIHARPLDIFLSYAGSGNAHAAEFYLGMYLLYGLGVLLLWQYPLFFWYAAVFYGFNLFVFHEDLSRYLLPIAPFALVIGYDQILRTKAFKFASLGLVILAYIYAWGVLPHNLVADWVYTNLLKVL